MAPPRAEAGSRISRRIPALRTRLLMPRFLFYEASGYRCSIPRCHARLSNVEKCLASCEKMVATHSVSSSRVPRSSFHSSRFWCTRPRGVYLKTHSTIIRHEAREGKIISYRRLKLFLDKETDTVCSAGARAVLLHPSRNSASISCWQLYSTNTEFLPPAL